MVFLPDSCLTGDNGHDDLFDLRCRATAMPMGNDGGVIFSVNKMHGTFEEGEVDTGVDGGVREGNDGEHDDDEEDDD